MADVDQKSRQRSRRAALGALAAELGHDLQGPANLFRLMTERLRAGHALDAEDLLLLDEELARLSQLGSRLRALAQRPLAKQRHTAEGVMRAAVAQLDGTVAGDLTLDFASGTAGQVDCDAELLALALAELLDNALEARATRAGLRFEATGRAGFCVWDDGAGFTLDPVSALAWGVTTKQFGAGLGLSVALRAARGHGFSLEIRRQGPLTEVWLLIVPREIESEPAKLPP